MNESPKFTPSGDKSCLTEVSVEDMKRMLAELGDKMDAETRRALRGDIAWAKAKGNDWLEYECF